METTDSANPTPAAPLTPEQEKSAAVKAYFEAVTREAKAAVVKQFPILKNIFSDANHS